MERLCRAEPARVGPRRPHVEAAGIAGPGRAAEGPGRLIEAEPGRQCCAVAQGRGERQVIAGINVLEDIGRQRERKRRADGRRLARGLVRKCRRR